MANIVITKSGNSIVVDTGVYATNVSFTSESQLFDLITALRG